MICDYNSQNNHEYEVLGFVDNNKYLSTKFVEGYRVYKTSHLSKKEKVYGICGVLDSKIRATIIKNEIEGRGLSLAKLVHPSINLPNDLKLGSGSLIFSNIHLSYNLKIGKGVIVAFGCDLGHDLKIGSFSSIMPGCLINGNCTIGKNCLISTGSIIKEKINIGDNCLIGIGSCIIKNVKKKHKIINFPRLTISNNY